MCIFKHILLLKVYLFTEPLQCKSSFSIIFIVYTSFIFLGRNVLLHKIDNVVFTRELFFDGDHYVINLAVNIMIRGGVRVGVYLGFKLEKKSLFFLFFGCILFW